MLLVIRKVRNRLAGQPDNVTSLRDIILKGCRGLNVRIGRCNGRIEKLSLEGCRVGVSKMPLPGLFDHPVSTGRFFPVQGGIRLFLFLKQRIIWRSQKDELIFLLEFLSEIFARATELKYLLAICQLL